LRGSLEQELAQQKQAEEQLRQELGEERTRLQTQVQTMSAERSKLAAAEATVATLKDKGAATERRLNESLAQEAKRRAGAESQARELVELRSSLEQELAQQKQAEERLRHELDEERTRLQTEVQSLSAERSKLEAKTQALAAAEATVATLKDKGAATERRLSESLAQEAERRAGAESQAHVLAELRSSLEQELAQQKQAEEQLRQELGEERTRLQTQVQTLSAERSKLEAKTRELEAVTGELSAACSQMTQEALEKRRLAARVVEEEHAKAELAKQLAAARERGTAGQMAVQSLESQVQQALAERVRLVSALQAEAAERRRLQLQSENLGATLDDVTSQLKEKTDAEAASSRRETESQDRLQKLQERITESGATLAVQEAELRGTKQKADELQLIQSALCAQVQQLTAAESALVKSRRAVEEELGASQQSIQDGRKELAALRYAMLDGSRVSSQASHGRVQMIRQSAAGVTQVISALMSSPLSLAQRRLASSLQITLDGWMKDQVDNHCANQLPVAAPVFRPCGFNLAEVTEGAFQAIQQQAAAAGIEVETTNSGNVPGNVVGDADHIGQLIALLPKSLLRLPETRRLGLQLSVEPALPGPAALNLQLLIAVAGAARETCERLTTIAAASGTLQTAQLGEAESGLAVCWQLAHALGGTVHLDASSDQDVRLQVVLPVEIPLASGVPELGAAPRPAAAVCQN
jgi:chromosome segregation ATPase